MPQIQRCMERYPGRYRLRRLNHWDQFLIMVFAQLTYRESLRDVEASLSAMPERLYHMGIRSRRIARSTLADANGKRDWRIYADFAQVLITEARHLYADEPLAVELDRTVYALDSITIDLCLSLFPWAHRQQGKSAVKLHTLLDLRGSIPAFAWITGGKVHDVNLLDVLIREPGSICVLDRGYVDFARLYALSELLATFVIRAKKPLSFRRLYSHPVDRTSGLICDHTIVLPRPNTAKQYPAKLRRVRSRDAETGKRITLLTNSFTLSALTVADLYRSRWQVELFFRWIKQHLRIKLRHEPQRRSDADLDRHLHVRPGRDPTEEGCDRARSLHNLTDPERQSIRESAYRRGTLERRLYSRNRKYS